MEKNIKIIHLNWKDDLYISSEYIYRSGDKQDRGKFIIKDFLLMIEWEKWDKEYFFYNIDSYYLLCDEFILLYHKIIEKIYIIYENKSDICFIYRNNSTIYKKKNINECGSVLADDLTIKWSNSHNDILEEFIFYNNKYYEKKYFLSIYELFVIYDDDENIKKIYVKHENVRKYKNKVCINDTVKYMKIIY